jgi:flagellar biosynthesis/type III secretory pathway chaperone
MTAPEPHANQSPLEDALHLVHATLDELLVAADQQHEAVVAQDREAIESVTRQQERLSVRLARAEARRIELVGDADPSNWTDDLSAEAAPRVDALKTAIASAVLDLQARQSQTADLLNQHIELASQTLNFLRSLVTQPDRTYTERGITNARSSVLLDGRA